MMAEMCHAKRCYKTEPLKHAVYKGFDNERKSPVEAVREGWIGLCVCLAGVAVAPFYASNIKSRARRLAF
jgi:hypothetical protein